MAQGKAKISSKSKSHPDYGKGKGSFFYNADEGTVLGRTAGSWAKITIFYIIYYIGLAAFACLNYYIFSRTLIENEPKWKLSESLIGSNPGVGFRPLPDQDATPGSTLIWYHSESDRDAKMWYKQLTEYIRDVDIPVGASGVVNCDYNSTRTDRKNACRVDISNLHGCSLQNKFGYLDAKPCILIKLNRIFSWEPEPFGVNDDDKYDPKLLLQDLDDKVNNDRMPVSLKNYILKEVAAHPGIEKDILKTIWISCQGENVGDKEHLPEGHISYFPKQGIPGYYFPYLNQKNYKSPFVMVELNLPATSRHVLINIECRAWARNIRYERAFRQGSVHFEVMVD